MRILAVIPARGGSKGIPRKNLVPVAGRPLIAWTIAHALESRYAVTGELDVVVSTEDDEIASVATAYGAQVPFRRPAELAEDTTATEPVVLHAIAAQVAAGREPDVVVLLQATSPVRTPGTVDRALDQFFSSPVDSLVGVVRQAPFLWREPAPGAAPAPEYDVDRRPRRQDLSLTQWRYRETGSIYVTRRQIYTQHHNRLGGRIGLFVMDEIEGVDIDSRLDLAIAEGLLAELESGAQSEPGRTSQA